LTRKRDSEWGVGACNDGGESKTGFLMEKEGTLEKKKGHSPTKKILIGGLNRERSGILGEGDRLG